MPRKKPNSLSPDVYRTEADRIAAERGGLCLSSEIPTIRSRALWKCANSEHPPWSAKFESVKGWSGKPGNWCRRCYAHRKAQMRLHSTAHVQAKLAERAIELLSAYKGIEEKIDCRCLRCEHKWTTRYRHITRGHGCPQCGNRKIAEQKRHSTEHFIKVLRARRITLLNVDHSTAMTRLDCRCDICGHAWKPLWNTIQGGGVVRFAEGNGRLLLAASRSMTSKGISKSGELSYFQQNTKTASCPFSFASRADARGIRISIPFNPAVDAPSAPQTRALRSRITTN